jgi:hypothetical protein
MIALNDEGSEGCLFFGVAEVGGNEAVAKLNSVDLRKDTTPPVKALVSSRASLTLVM